MDSVVNCSELFSSILSFLPLHYWYSYKSICKKWLDVSQTNTFKKKQKEVKDHPTEFHCVKSLVWSGHYEDVICCIDEENTLYSFENCKMYMMNIDANQLLLCCSFLQYASVVQAVARNKHVIFVDDDGDLYVIDLLKKVTFPERILNMPKIKSMVLDDTHFYFAGWSGSLFSIPKNSIFQYHAEGIHYILDNEKYDPLAFSVSEDYIIKGFRKKLSFYDKHTNDRLFQHKTFSYIRDIKVSHNLIFVTTSDSMEVYQIDKGKQKVLRNERLVIRHFPWVKFCLSKDHLLTWWSSKKDGIRFAWFRMV